MLLYFPLKAEDKKSEKEPYLVGTRNFRVLDFGIKQIDFGITTMIYNPYRVKVKIEEIVIDVFIEDKKLGTILEAADIVKIPKEDTFDLPLEIAVNTGNTIAKFASESIKIATNKKVKVDYKGYIKIKALGFIPVKVKINEIEYFTKKDIFPEEKTTTPAVKKPTTLAPKK